MNKNTLVFLAEPPSLSVRLCLYTAAWQRCFNRMVLQRRGDTTSLCVCLNVSEVGFGAVSEWLVSQCECRHRELVLAGLCVSVQWDAGLRSHSPLCRVCRPPDKTPRGSVPVGVSPLSCNTLSFSSLVTHRHTNKNSYMSDQ